MSKAEIEAFLNSLGVKPENVIAINFDNAQRAVFDDRHKFSYDYIKQYGDGEYFVKQEIDWKGNPYFVAIKLDNIQGIIVGHPSVPIENYDIRSIIQ